MPDTLADLERQRARILSHISQLGDLRPGSITTISGRCGKPNCPCHQPRHPGHGPNFRLTRKVHGKTISETFPDPAALRKAQREVAAFHRFRELTQSFLEVSEKICRLRPVETLAEEEPTAEEKKRRKRSSKRSPRK